MVGEVLQDFGGNKCTSWQTTLGTYFENLGGINGHYAHYASPSDDLSFVLGHRHTLA